MGNVKIKPEIQFKYVIPEQLPDCYTNGAFGGVTPRGEIHIHFYSERNPVPKEAVASIEKKDGSIKKIEEITGSDVIRLVQASLVMDVNTAVSIRNWLDDRIKNVHEIQEGLKEEPKRKTKRKKGK